MAKEDSSLDKFKKEFKKLKERYNLPSFEFINQNFEIEGICIEDTDIPLKRVRKQIMEKVFWYLRTFETFLNPQNASMFIFNVIKGFSQKDKELVSKLYGKFAEYEIESFGLEIGYNEEKEASFIKKVCEEWKELSKDLEVLHKSMEKSYNSETKKQDKSYFG